jgi:transcription elongation GreA/GreB family factor
MSRAFVKEDDGNGGDELPERPISPHPNLVTANGLALIDAEIRKLGDELTTTPIDDRAARGRINRDLRYWRVRRATAEVIEPTTDRSKVQFGSTVTIEREDGRRQTWRIVGEDEADPEKGTISYVAPLARALIGKSMGDEVQAGNSGAEITEIQ